MGIIVSRDKGLYIKGYISRMTRGVTMVKGLYILLCIDDDKGSHKRRYKGATRGVSFRGLYISTRTRGVTFRGITDKISCYRSGRLVNQGREIIWGSRLLPYCFLVAGYHIVVLGFVKSAVAVGWYRGWVDRMGWVGGLIQRMRW